MEQSLPFPPYLSSVEELPEELYGKCFVFTGTLRNMSVSQAREYVTMLGGFSRTSMTHCINIVVLGEKEWRTGIPSAKHWQALSLRAEGHDIHIISEDTFRLLIKRYQNRDQTIFSISAK